MICPSNNLTGKPSTSMDVTWWLDLGISLYETLGTQEGHKKCKFDGKKIQKKQEIYLY